MTRPTLDSSTFESCNWASTPHILKTPRNAIHPTLTASAADVLLPWNWMGSETDDAVFTNFSNTGVVASTPAALHNNGTNNGNNRCWG